MNEEQKKKPRATARYIVASPFKYGGRLYQEGEDWTPTGGAWDKQIIEQKKLVKQKDDVANVNPRRKSKLRDKVGTERSESDGLT